MKKIIALFLCLMMMLTALPVLAESGMAGGWTANEDAAMTPEALAALEKAKEGYVGANLEPVALLGTQVVAGVNYCILCRVTPVVPNAQSHYALAYVYADLQGGATLLRVTDVDMDAAQYDEGDEFPDYDAESTTLDHFITEDGVTMAVDRNGDVYDLFELNQLVRDENGKVHAIAGRFVRIDFDEELGGEYPKPMPSIVVFELAEDVKGTALDYDLDDVPVDDVRAWLSESQAAGADSIFEWYVTVYLTVDDDDQVTFVQEMYVPWA